MIKRLTALLTVLAVLAGFAACKKDEDETTTVKTDETTTYESETVLPGTISTTVAEVTTLPEEDTTVSFSFSKSKAKTVGSFDSDIFGKLTVYLQDDMLAIFDEFGTMKFVTGANGYSPSEVSVGALIEGEDMNFDGHTDFRILYSLGTVNSYYHCYLWDRSTTSFVYYSPLSQICSPSFDADDSTVTSYTRSTGASSKVTIYNWQNGELTPISNHTVEDETTPGAEIVNTTAIISDGNTLASIKLSGKDGSVSRWMCRIENEDIVGLYSDSYDSETEVYTFIFDGKSVGTTTVLLRFVPAWEADYVSEKILNITVDEDKNLTIKEIQ